ncbi:hypothetical protein FXE84_06035 [Vibrio cholerae]|uniref:hypothetical protein n=1 Tax=Vibrio cholerae TaxID=666 RepID=UPI0004E44BFC|nr:hypothetical protein [Vibrio cholerae]KFE25495.1 hypothetical protein DN30_3852 [Vibrio cholerae]TXY43190.1 hypothetical protein FXE84_06035 [Vibrio cholerae]GHX02071.1 hypothetical protein VCSRO105_3705 [Vibrio cholerae]
MNDSVLVLYERSVAIKDKIKPILGLQESKFTGGDIRVSLIGKPLNSIVLQILFFKSNVATFYNHSWWDQISIPEIARKGFTERVDGFYKYYIFIQFVSIVESEFRLLVREVTPGACNNGKAPFVSIYQKVLSELKLNKYMDLFDFIRLIRNAVHNNGVYLPEKNDSERVINFKNKEYKFIYGEEIDFFYPELLADIQDEIFDCLCEIISHDKLIA